MRNQRLPWLVFALEAMVLLASVVSIAAQGESGTNFIWLFPPLAYAAVGALAASRRPENRIGWIYLIPGAFLLLLPLQGIFESLFDLSTAQPWGTTLDWLASLGWVGFLGTMLTLTWLYFPDGRLPSPRWRAVLWAILIGIPLTALNDILEGLPGNFMGFIPQALGGIGEIILLVGILGSAASIAFRYRRGQAAERQQVKWVATAVAMAVIVAIFDIVIEGWFQNTLAYLALQIIFPLAITAVPVAAGIAILRYQLWGIDLIIRRTLVYGVLTLTLALVYLGAVTLLQSVLSTVTGQQSTAAIVLSTLAIAALFNPLRRHIQHAIDRRFFRRKYDAEKALAAFGQTVREEVDLEVLSQALLVVVNDTMQPERSTLWLLEVVDGRSSSHESFGLSVQGRQRIADDGRMSTSTGT